MPIRFRRASLFALCVASAALAQGGQGGAQQNQPDLSKLPPPVLLGARVETVRRNIPVADTVVIVPTKEAFVDALSRWSLQRRFPILLDDGTALARENIARFVRAFQPRRVVRWQGERTVWPQSVEAQRQLMADALAKAWGAESFERLPQAFNAASFIPPGVVVLSESDPLALGGLALAAGRGQIPLWFTRADDSLPASFSGEITEQQAAQLRAMLETELDQIGLPWRAVGDTIDAITIAFTLPGRVASPDGQRDRTSPILALGDYLGRHASGDRYAWTGLLVGDQQQGVYSAMCSLFLVPDRAWLFNGYKAEGAFASYDPSPVRQPLLDFGIEPSVDTAPFSGVQHWKRRLTRGVTAGLIHVNSSGMRRTFNLNPGVARGADVPALNVPAIVHFVHSFSAQDVGDKASIARRFIDHGAYVYVGSVDEPYLTAFGTPEQFVRRLLAYAPVGAAARHDASPPWKINIYGDPLTTVGPRAKRVETDLELPGAVDVEERMRSALKDGRYAEAAEALLLLGRDADLTRLYNAARANPDATVDAPFARAAFSALFRTGERDAMLDAASRLGPKGLNNTPMQDMLWHAFDAAQGASAVSPQAAEALRNNLRGSNLVEDAEDAASATNLAEGPQSARAFLERLIGETRNERTKQRLADLLGRYQ